MKKRWSITPRHLLRKRCVESVVKAWRPSGFLEMGAGTGDFTALFLERGYHGTCYDPGEENRAILRENLKAYQGRIEVAESIERLHRTAFDYLFAFEVLEHIREDADELRTWSSFLKPGGRILLSVPAHMKKYGSEDRFAGHIRRYEKTGLRRLLEGAGYGDIHILSYGFPFGNITRLFSNLFHAFHRGRDALSPEERSIRSGIERIRSVNRLSFAFNEFSMAPFLFLQGLFLNRDWGTGYVAHGEKLI